MSKLKKIIFIIVCICLFIDGRVTLASGYFCWNQMMTLLTVQLPREDDRSVIEESKVKEEIEGIGIEDQS